MQHRHSRVGLKPRTREAATLAALWGVIVVAGRLVPPPSSEAVHQPPMISTPIVANAAAKAITLRPLIRLLMLRQICGPRGSLNLRAALDRATLCDRPRGASRLIRLHDRGYKPNEKEPKVRIFVVELEHLVFCDRIETAVAFADGAHGPGAVRGK
jgi:hypothetical protein